MHENAIRGPTRASADALHPCDVGPRTLNADDDDDDDDDSLYIFYIGVYRL